MMSAYAEGWKLVLGHFKMWGLFYVCNVLFALVAAYPLNGFLQSTIGDSLAIMDSLPGFDYTFVTGFLNQYGKGFSLILNQSFLVIGAFLLFSVFLSGGILEVFKRRKEDFAFAHFWSGCGKYFFRLLRLMIYFMVGQGTLLFLAWTCFKSLSGGLSPFVLETDRDWVNAFKIILPFYLFFASLFMMLHDYAKIHIIHQGKSLLFQPIFQAIKMVFQNFFSCIFLYLLNFATFLLFFGIYYIVRNLLNADTMTSILLIFVVGQFFILARIATKLLNLGSATVLYQERLRASLES